MILTDDSGMLKFVNGLTFMLMVVERKWQLKVAYHEINDVFEIKKKKKNFLMAFFFFSDAFQKNFEESEEGLL